MGALSAEIDAELGRLNVVGWRAALARSLAAELDDEPNASMAKELRSLMGELGSSAAGVKKGNTGDELARQRAARIAKATGT
jgi:hypothetical protein